MKLVNKVKKLREKGLSYAKIALKLGIHPSTAWRTLNNYDRKAESFKIKERRNFLKRRLVEHRGGKCEICGYDKSIRALEFHHIDPQSKKMSISKEFLQFSVNNPNSGDGVENIKAKFNSSDIAISFNSKYLIDIASQIEIDSIIMNLKDAGSPALIKDLNDKNSIHVVMPMKI